MEVAALVTTTDIWLNIRDDFEVIEIVLVVSSAERG